MNGCTRCIAANRNRRQNYCQLRLINFVNVNENSLEYGFEFVNHVVGVHDGQRGVQERVRVGQRTGVHLHAYAALQPANNVNK